jgi:hypothetical protein
VLFRSVYPSATGGANTAEPTVFSEQTMYFPTSLTEFSSTQSSRYAVTGLNFQTVTVTTIEFWS